MAIQEPFPLASDYKPVSEEPFQLREAPEDTPPPMSGPAAMTIPQRMYAMEQRQVLQGRDISSLNEKMDRALKMLSWKATVSTGIKAGAPLLLTALAAQFPQAKVYLKALLDALSVMQ